jgi:hypothetical protein
MSNQETVSTNRPQELPKSDEKGQYTLWQILGIWPAGGAPLWIFAWLVHPALSQGLPALDQGLLWMKLMLAGLVWQFVLSMLILYREEGSIRISTIGRRFWLNNPVSPRTGQKDNRLWWLLVPLMLLVAALELGLAPLLNGIWTKLFPFLAEPQSRSLGALFAPRNAGSLDRRVGFLFALCDLIAIQQLPE